MCLGVYANVLIAILTPTPVRKVYPKREYIAALLADLDADLSDDLNWLQHRAYSECLYWRWYTVVIIARSLSTIIYWAKTTL
jgi:hypothetical protein